MALPYLFRENGKSGCNRRGVFTCEFARLPELTSKEGVLAENEGYFDHIDHFDESGSKWYGGLSTMQEAKDLILKGWQDGATKASSAASDGGVISTITQPESIRRRPVWGDEGDELSVERALDGNWDLAYRTMSRVRTYGSKIVSLGGQFGGNCDKSADQLFWSGAQIVVAAELLEMAGYQCEVRGLHCNMFWEGDGAQSVIEFRAKEAGDPLRLDAIASIFAHAGVFRTYGFMAICRMPWNVGSGLGRTMEGAEADALIEKVVAEGNMAPVDAMMPLAYDKATAIRNIMAVITKITGEGGDDE